MITTIRRPVVTQCPFRDELDARELVVTFAGAAPELHALDAKVQELCAGPVSHEDFLRQVTELVADTGAMVMKVAATGRGSVGTWDIEVAETPGTGPA